jgi:hypothetical protein
MPSVKAQRASPADGRSRPVEARRPAKFGRAHLRPAEAARIRPGLTARARGCGVSVALPDDELSVSAIVERWAEDDPRWEALIAAV